FAATGWVEEDGTWYFYDSDGNRVEDVWKKSGDNWYWLDSEEGGAMAIDKLVEDDDDTYYVDSNGVMVRNTWVKVVNEDQDEDDDPAEYHYYYMQSNGKAYKAPDSANVRFRTIDGKRYAFDDDGIMLYGWVTVDGERETDEDGWAETDTQYYLGSWDDGAMKTGWQKITVHDDNEDDDMDYWFNFKSNGKKRFNETDNNIDEVRINGRRYGFDTRGVMTYEWTLATSGGTGMNSVASTTSWRYFNNVDDGARVTKGWFRVIAPSDDNDNTFISNYGVSFADDDADDENERWYYADGDGQVISGQIKKIKGKYYGFRPEGTATAGDKKAGAMLSGLVLMKVDPATGVILEVLDDDVDSDDLDDLLDNVGTNAARALADPDISLYYFGNDEAGDGSMKTGATTVTLDGDTFNFFFRKTGGIESRGKGLTGVDDNKYIYKYGCRIKAGSDDKYQVVTVEPNNGAVDIQEDGVKVTKISSRSLKVGLPTFINEDGETVSYNDISSLHTANLRYYLVNTSGNIQKSKVAAKDGDDWYFYVKDRALLLYTNNKNLDDNTTTRTNWENWCTVGRWEY
ncbi:hypothetical protein D3Z51_19980, partial [Clostridiaceae bacterium]